MLLTFIANKTKCNSLVQRFAALGHSSSVSPFDIPDGEWKPLVRFQRVHRLTADVPMELAVKALEWAANASDGTWASISSGNFMEATEALSEHPDVTIQATAIERRKDD